ncbi:MAG: pyridoxamine 5'-phosphate oxidase family protein, partial [Gammaproteobacteria bacterium]|nr:pyridoxamine 5'-phosphate oxidase family protein [Gammaproteobacteria bacterium]
MHPITDPVADIITHRNLARDAGDSNADICFLALADKEGSASVRTLVLRGIQDRGFSVFINQSSPKWQILFSGGHWQLLLWYGSQQKQYRLSGTVNAIDDTIVKESWQYRPLGSKLLDNVYE